MTTYDYLIQEGMEKGKAEGIEKGRELVIKKVILNAHANNIDLDAIRLITGKSIDEIKTIIQKSKA